MYSTLSLRRAYKVVNAFEYPLSAGEVAEPCAPGKPLLNLILSGLDSPAGESQALGREKGRLPGRCAADDAQPRSQTAAHHGGA